MQADFSNRAKLTTTQDQDSFFSALKTALEQINQNGTSGITFTTKSQHDHHLIEIGVEGYKGPLLKLRLCHATIRLDLDGGLKLHENGLDPFVKARDLFRSRFLVTEQADGCMTQATYEYHNFASGKPFPQGNVERVTDFVKELHERLAPLLKTTATPRPKDVLTNTL